MENPVKINPAPLSEAQVKLIMASTYRRLMKAMGCSITEQIASDVIVEELILQVENAR